MVVTATTLSTAGDLTFSTLKTFVKDQMGDQADAKAVRRQERIVNQALRFLAGSRLWSWHLRKHRIIFRPRLQYTSAISISAEGNTVTLLSGTWASDAAKRTLYLSGDTEMMRIRRRDSSTQLTTFSTDIYVASTDASGVTGFLVQDRIQLDANFRCLATDIHQKDFFGPDGEISREEMLHLNQTYSPSSGSPINYTLEMNPYANRWEIQVWQWPSELRSADFYWYVWPAMLTNDSDVANWDPNLSEILYSALNLKCLEELRKWDEWRIAEKALQNAIRAASNADRKSLVARVAGRTVHPIKRMQLHRLFTSGS